MSRARRRTRMTRHGTPRLARIKLVALVTILALVLLAMWQLSLVVERHASQPQATPIGRVAPLEVTAIFLAAIEGGERPLADGDTVRPGDRIALRLSSQEPVHAYALNEDDRGEIFVLFPASGLDASNPLTATVTHRLPGTANGEPQDWVVSSAGGTETLLLICSRDSLPALEGELAELREVDASRPVRYGKLDPDDLSVLRGVTGTRPVDTRMIPPGERLARIADAAQGSDLHVTRVRLRNPGD